MCYTLWSIINFDYKSIKNVSLRLFLYSCACENRSFYYIYFVFVSWFLLWAFFCIMKRVTFHCLNSQQQLVANTVRWQFMLMLTQMQRHLHTYICTYICTYACSSVPLAFTFCRAAKRVSVIVSLVWDRNRKRNLSTNCILSSINGWHWPK